MAGCWTSSKSLSEPMRTQLINGYMRHQAWWVKHVCWRHKIVKTNQLNAVSTYDLALNLVSLLSSAAMSRNWYKWSKWTYFPFFKTILQTEDWDISRFNFQLLIGFILSLQNKHVYTYTWELLRCSINISWKVPIHQLGSSDPSWFIGIFQLMFL